jgi:hypothetical protein
MVAPSMTTDRQRSLCNRSSAWRMTLAGMACGLALAAPRAAHAQDGERALNANLPALSRVVPAEAQIFVEIDGLPRVNALLSQRNIWQMIRQSLTAADIGGWQKLLADTLGVESQEEIARLFSERVAIAAIDGEHLADGIIVFTQSDPTVLRRATAEPGYKAAQRVGSVRVLQSTTGLWIAMRGRVIVISRTYHSQSIFRRAVDLLDGRSSESLARSPAFQKLTSGLPSPRAGCIYWSSPDDAGPTSQPSAGPAGPWPNLARGAISLHVRGNRLELYLRGEPVGTVDGGYRPRIVFDRFATLPQTTLAAWAGSTDVREIYDLILNDDSIPALGTILDPLRRAPIDETFRDEIVANLGPRFVVIISADLLSGEMRPELGVMIESTDATGVAARLRDLMDEIAHAVTPDDDTTEYLGSEILQIHLPPASIDPDHPTLASLIAKDLTPSVAAMHGWVVVSTSPDHVRRIIEAGNGLNAALGEIPVIARSERSLRRSISAAIVQPAFALSALRHWMGWMQSSQEEDDAEYRLGIRVRPDSRAGQVVVDDVDSNGPSGGLVAPGDVIIGLESQLLAMNKPYEHLEALLAASEPNRPIRLRVLRGDQMAEVVVEAAAPRAASASTAEMRGTRLGLLQEMAGELATAVYSVARSSPSEYRGHLVLEFEEIPVGAEAPPEREEEAPPPE